MKRAVHLRRSWLFIGGADRDALWNGPESGADVLIQELEDFCTPENRPEARAMMGEVLAHWKSRGAVAAVRINPLETGDGLRDLEAAMAAGPDAVLLPKANLPSQITGLDDEITQLESAAGVEAGTTEIVPNIEQALGLRNCFDILNASPRITAALVASEDMATSLGAERRREINTLDHVRARFHVDCCAAGVFSIDMPYTWTDTEGLERDLLEARALGFKGKSAVTPTHAATINALLTPTAARAEEARSIVEAFESARRTGASRAEHRGSLVEIPIYLQAKDTVKRAEDFGVIPVAPKPTAE
jgi:citrate lyase subunit beta/citryl-CoA lyase